MKKNVSVAEMINLSVAERIELVEDLWDSIAQVPEAVKLSCKQKQELDKRLRAYHRQPQTGSPWLEVRERIRNKK